MINEHSRLVQRFRLVLRKAILFVIGVIQLSGCSKYDGRDKNVVEWLNRGHDCATIVGCKESWIDEGKAIPDVERQVTLLVSKRDHRVELEVATAFLAECATQESVPVLIESLKSENELVVVNCALALGRLRTREAVPQLARLVESSSAGIRVNAAGALAEIGGKEAEGILKAQLDLEKFVYDSLMGYFEKIQRINLLDNEPSDDADGPF